MQKQSEHNLVDYILDVIDGDRKKFASIKKGSGEKKNELLAFLDELPGGFFIYRASEGEQILYANQAVLRMFACKTYDEFIALTGGSFRGLVHPDDLDEVEESIERQIRMNVYALDYVEYRITRSDGIVRWVEDYGHYAHSDDGGIFYVFISDATEKISKRMAEKAEFLQRQRESDAKIQNIIEEYDKERKLIRQEHLRRLEVIEGLSVEFESILYIDLDADSITPYRVSVRTRHQFDEALHKRGYVAFVRDYIGSWVHPDDKAMVSLAISPEYIRERLRKSISVYRNYRCIRDGKIDYLQLRVVKVGDAEGQIVLGMRNIEEELKQDNQQKQMLEQALQAAHSATIAKNTFLSNVSHDMRTPLNAIFGYLELARKHRDEGRSAWEYLDKIEEAGRRILDQIDKVLEVSYAESNDFELTETPCDLGDIMRDVGVAVTELAARKRIEVVLDVPDVPFSVCADADKLHKVLSHIAINAVKYTDNGGRVTMSLREYERRTDDFCIYRFTVTDTGIGIAAENVGRIFEPFMREKGTTHSGVFGAGLGLTIAKYIVEKMGGSITVESKQGKGSTFTVTVGLRSESKEAAAKSSQSVVERLRGKQILIVEDNEINLEIETELLRDIGFEVDTAEDGKAALEKVRVAAPGQYGLILMDLQMPIMNGWDAAKAIRQLTDTPVAHIPIIAVSANSFESDKRASAAAGINDHIGKPMDVETLLDAIEKVLG